MLEPGETLYIGENNELVEVKISPPVMLTNKKYYYKEDNDSMLKYTKNDLISFKNYFERFRYLNIYIGDHLERWEIKYKKEGKAEYDRVETISFARSDMPFDAWVKNGKWDI